MLLGASLAGVLLLAGFVADDPPKADTTYTITVETSEVPEMADYGKKVEAVAKEWYPKIIAMLPSEGYKAPETVTIRFTPTYKGVAAASGNRIVCAPQWFKDHPDDLGAIVHELTHVVQQYRRGRRPGWLVEGIADHVRFFTYEPESQRPKPRAGRAKYDDSYRTTAAFLDWAQTTYDKDLVISLNTACREAKYSDDLWKERTGHSLEELGQLWQDHLAGKKPAEAK
jgi:hypothetical protein